MYTIALPAFFIWNGATINPSIPASATYTHSTALNISYPLAGVLAAANANPSLAASSGLAAATVSRATIQQNERTPYTYNFNLTAEQAFGKSRFGEEQMIGIPNPYPSTPAYCSRLSDHERRCYGVPPVAFQECHTTRSRPRRSMPS